MVALALAAAQNAHCQTTNTKVTPDCLFTGSVSTSGNSTVTANGNGDNRSVGCNFWVVVWEITGGGSPTVTVQSAITSSGQPTSWGAFNGTVVSGSNPSTDTVGTVVLSGYVPWIRVNLASGGTLSVRMFGYRYPGSSAGGGGGGGGGGTTCNLQSVVSATASGNTQIVAASTGQTVKICHLSVGLETPVNVRLVRGTGANCATSTVALTGFYYGVAGLAFDRDPNPITAGTTGAAVCLGLSSASNVGGLVIYAYE